MPPCSKLPGRTIGGDSPRAPPSAELEQAAVGAAGVGVLGVEADGDAIAPPVGAERLDARAELFADRLVDREAIYGSGVHGGVISWSRPPAVDAARGSLFGFLEWETTTRVGRKRGQEPLS